MIVPIKKMNLLAQLTLTTIKHLWCQDNKYIAFEDGIAGVQTRCTSNVNKRFGDCKGMAILTYQALQAGFDARVVWIGTDSAHDYLL
jgi:hypothetical protein